MGEWHLSPRIKIDIFLTLSHLLFERQALFYSYISTPNGLHSTSTTETETEEIEITSQSNFGFEEFFIFKSLKTKQS